MSELVNQEGNEKFEACRQYLLSLGADKLLHSGRHFLTHLEGTYRLLQSWGQPESVCYAGLFHSMYGTDGFKHNALTIDDRQEPIGIYTKGCRTHWCICWAAALFCCACCSIRSNQGRYCTNKYQTCSRCRARWRTVENGIWLQ